MLENRLHYSMDIPPWHRCGNAKVERCFTHILQCQLLSGDPILAVLDPLAVDPLRYNFNTFSIAFAAMDICFDVVVLCFPLPVIHHLMMSTQRKLELIGIFWLGIVYVLIICCFSLVDRVVNTDTNTSVAVLRPFSGSTMSTQRYTNPRHLLGRTATLS